MLPTIEPVRLERVAKTPSLPVRVAASEASNQASKYSRVLPMCASQRQISGAWAACQRSSACASSSGSRTTNEPSSRMARFSTGPS